jgi:exonuclease SbcD
VRTRAAGISQTSTIAEKVRAWARATEARAEPLLECLEALQTRFPETIAADVLNRQSEPNDTPRSIAFDEPAAPREKIAAPERLA